ncbi:MULTISPECIES: glycoside hydrolase family 3 N-terminal domain-containing protein [unclassified Agarivorans]|uniref:glycoside hydrolase family 3 protein n=1 Tax=unclassified Agarivorans TaxID=2636026 RepID=UPI003D7ED09F
MKITMLVLILTAVTFSLLNGCGSDDRIYFQPSLGYKTLSLIEVDNYHFKDLNRDGQLSPYEDWRLTSAERASDLVSQMNTKQKAGLMMHGTLPLDSAGRISSNAMTPLLNNYVNTFITRMAGDPLAIAEDNNALQQRAEAIGLGIPVTISTDPRNHFINDPNATAVGAGGFSQWPELLGFAALNDPELVKEFADIARQEYRTVGIHEALSPQADLSTEPRWGRSAGTFGEDNIIAKNLVGAYIEGFQRGIEGLNPNSVISVVKHFAGGGPQLNGFDAHNHFGKEQVYPGSNFQYHLLPFEGAFDANVGSVMPYYGQPIGLNYNDQHIEAVGFGFNKQILDTLLRGKYNFKGVVLSDWGIVNDCNDKCQLGLSDQELTDGVSVWTVPFGMSWGVEPLSIAERYAKSVDAGVDQFGGVQDPSHLLEAIAAGLITNEQIDKAAQRILIQKFDLGLFENPYVDTSIVTNFVGNEDFQRVATKTQSRAHVLLKNDAETLPLSPNKTPKVYLYQVNAQVATDYGFTVVDKLEDADIAILRVNTPYETDPRLPFGNVHFGQLGFFDQTNLIQDQDHQGVYSGSEDYAAIQAATAAAIPTVISIYLDRPAILTAIEPSASALLANFGALDSAFFDVLLGKTPPQGHLPFELPSSWQAVLEQDEDVAHDSANPLYQLGFGLSY